MRGSTCDGVRATCAVRGATRDRRRAAGPPLSALRGAGPGNLTSSPLGFQTDAVRAVPNPAGSTLRERPAKSSPPSGQVSRYRSRPTPSRAAIGNPATRRSTSHEHAERSTQHAARSTQNAARRTSNVGCRMSNADRRAAGFPLSALRGAGPGNLTSSPLGFQTDAVRAVPNPAGSTLRERPAKSSLPSGQVSRYRSRPTPSRAETGNPTTRRTSHAARSTQNAARRTQHAARRTPHFERRGGTTCWVRRAALLRPVHAAGMAASA